MASYAFDLIGTVFENVFKIVQHNPDTRHVLSILCLMGHKDTKDMPRIRVVLDYLKNVLKNRPD